MDNQCWICGKKEPVMYTCRYCGKTFCSDHRLPERHGCEGLGDGTRFSSAQNAAGSSGTRGRSTSGTDQIVKDFFKEATKNAAKGAAGSAFNRTKRSFYTSPSMAIIIICIFSFFLELLLGQPYYTLFQLEPGNILSRPWTLISHMFLHASLGHLFFNMLVLYFFGRILERRIGNSMFIYLYFISGVVAALGFIATTSTSYPMVGASGAIMGVFATLAILEPNLPVYVFFFPMTIKSALILFVIVDLFFMYVNISGDMIAHAAHLSGVFVGIIVGRRLKKNLKVPRGSLYRRW